MGCRRCHSEPCCCNDTPCPTVICSGITEVTDRPSCLSTFFKWSKSACFKPIDALLNLYCAIKDVSAAIREYADAVQVKGYASGFVVFSTESGTEVDPEDEVVTQYSKSPFTNKVIGIGVSTQDWNECGGAYVGESILEIRFWDFTAGSQIGNTLTLTSSSLHDKDTDEGNTISDNVAAGHVFGAKVKYTNDEGASCTLPKLDFYYIFSPIDVITEE